MSLKNITLIMLCSLVMSGCASTHPDIVPPGRQPVSSKTEKALSLGIIGSGLLLEYLADTNAERKLAKDIAEFGFKAFASQSSAGISSAVYREHVANQKAKFVSEEDYLAACIHAVKRVNIETYEYNATLEKHLGEVEEFVTSVNNRAEKGHISKIEFEQARQKVQQVRDEAEHRLQRARDEILIQREVRKREEKQLQSHLAELDAQIEQLEQSAAELDSTIKILAAMQQTMKL
jgi:hypothetical protein